jgi:hypothetical protein
VMPAALRPAWLRRLAALIGGAAIVGLKRSDPRGSRFGVDKRLEVLDFGLIEVGEQRHVVRA